MSTEQGPVQLRDIRGPSALSGGWRRFWELLTLLSINEFKRTYFGTALGYLWSVARPLALFAVLVEVFTHVFRVAIPHYPVFLLMNIVLFGFFQEATTNALPSILLQEGIVRKTQFPRLAIPAAVVLTAFYNLCLNLIVVFVFIIAFGVSPRWTWLLLPVIVALMGILALAVAMLVSSLYPRFRDLAIIWSVFVTALFYATPIIYPLEVAAARSHTLGQLVAMNPLTPILELARRWIIDPSAPYPGTPQAGGPVRLMISIAISVAVCIVAVWVFRREAPRIAEEL